MAQICAQLEEGQGDRAALFEALSATFGRVEAELLAQLNSQKSAAS